MTSSSEQPPKEYIITEEQLDKLAVNAPQKVWDESHYKIYHEIHNRPHPAPATNGFIPLSFMTMHRSQLFTASDVCALIERHREEAARKAREDMLGEFKWMKPICFGNHEAICDTRCAWAVRERCCKSTTPHTEQEQPR